MRRPLASAVLLLGLAGGAAHGAVRAWLDNSRIGSGDTVQLTLQRDGQTSAQPDLAPLKQDFDVLSVGSSNSVQIVNGSISSHTDAQIVLSPKHAGRLTVPPIDWGGETSPALTLTVANAAAAAGGNAATAGGSSAARAAGAGSPPVFVDTVVATKNPYVQAAVDVTVRVYTTERLYQASLNFPGDSDVLMQQIGGDGNGSAVRNGQQYDVVERHYVIFPQRSGTLHIPGAVLAGEIAVRMRADPFGNDPFANFFGGAAGLMTGTKPIRVQGEPITLDVRARPAASGTGPWLPAKNLTLQGEWQPGSLRVQAGNPITLDLHVTADGLTAAQLPDVSAMLALPPGLEAYPDDAKLKTAARGEVVVGTRDQSLALIADHAGRYVLPALHLSWWNTATEQAQTADLPGATIDVQPAPGGALAAGTGSAGARAGTGPGVTVAGAAASGATHGRGPTLLRSGRRWILVSAGLGLLWIATLLGWWSTRRRVPLGARRPEPPESAVLAVPPAESPPSAARARAKFHDACRRSDAPAARRYLLAWVEAAWPDTRAAGLGALAKRFADPRVAEAFGGLDRACYAGAAWDGEQLAVVLKELPGPRARGAAPDSPIAPLYR